MSDCLFCKIIAGEIPSAKVYEDELCYAFKDISPLAPMHFLVIPKQHFASAAEVTPENEAVVGHIYSVIAKLAKEQGFADDYRVVTNVGELAGQTVHTSTSTSSPANSSAASTKNKERLPTEAAPFHK